MMELEEALKLVDQMLYPNHLSTVQELVFRQCWVGQTYQEIAENFDYDYDYIRGVGARLWQNLSNNLGEKITKNNFHAALRMRSHLQGESNVTPKDVKVADVEILPEEQEEKRTLNLVLELPEGQVPLKSNFYIERPPIESLCCETILQPGALIRIKAPKRRGKTSLMIRILHHAREQGFQTIPLSLRLADTSVLSDLNRFLKWFCAIVSRGLGLPNRIAGYWDDIFGANYNTTDYFENYLLPEISTPVVLALDNVDELFRYRELATDFFSLLRAWFEKMRYGDASSAIWQNLKLLVAHSTEVYVPLNINQSPFNVGLSVELPEFTLPQIQALVSRYQLDYAAQFGPHGARELMTFIGGNPYLVRLALYHISRGDVTLDQLLQTATSENSIFSDYLRQQLLSLEQRPQLESVYGLIVNSPLPTVELEPIKVYELQGMGLVRVENHQALPSCELYHQYFKNRLGIW